MPRSRSPVRHRSRSGGRYRSRSRSRSPARHRSRSRGRYDRKRDRGGTKEKRPRRNSDEEVQTKAPDKKSNEDVATDKNGEISLSIEETNKLRISMGLKPLRLTKSAADDKEVNLAKSREQVEDDARKKAIKEALEKSKRKREYTEKLKGQSLGEILQKDAPNSALDWVRQSRQKKTSAVADATTKHDVPKQYTAEELKGLTVVHDAQTFEEGEEVILTLKDQRILSTDLNDVNDEGDELENVEISEADRRAEREERMKRASGPVYSGFDDDEFTSVIGVKAPLKKRLLAQYDEEDDFVAARERKKFALSDAGSHQIDKAVPVETAKSGSLSLATNKQQAIEEYYTADEMALFAKKKSKKLRKKQKTRQVVADEEEEVKEEDANSSSALIEQLEQQAPSSTSADHGKRSNAANAPTDETNNRMRFEHARKRANERVQVMVEKMKHAADDIDEELSESLARSRRAALLHATDTTKTTAPGQAPPVVLQLLATKPTEANIFKETTTENTVVFSEATDFEARVKNAMDERAAAAAAAASTTHKDHKHLTATTVEEEDEEEIKEEVNEDEEDEEEEAGWGVEEPLVQSGMAATIALLRNRGDLKDHIQVRQAGRANDYREKDVEDELTIKDGVKLDYRDEFGRLLTKKEAFRRISYRFHGHTPGKKKQEKRLKQLKEELAQQKNLGSVEQRMQTLEKRQKVAKQAHVVLSG